MKIGDARKLYSDQNNKYWEKLRELSKQRTELEKKMNSVPDGKTIYANEAAILELTIQAVDEKQQENSDYLNQLFEQKTAIENMLVAEQQGDAMKEYTEDMGKLLEVARRIMQGGIVPGSDEKKLMEYNMQMYMTAKNIGTIARQGKQKEFDTLWEEEKETDYADSSEVADNSEAAGSGPELVSVADTIASVALPE